MIKVHQQFPPPLGFFGSLKLEPITKAARMILEANPTLTQSQAPQIYLLLQDRYRQMPSHGVISNRVTDPEINQSSRR